MPRAAAHNNKCNVPEGKDTQLQTAALGFELTCLVLVFCAPYTELGHSTQVVRLVSILPLKDPHFAKFLCRGWVSCRPRRAGD